MMIMIEHWGGAFPVWLSPVQVKVLPITDRNVAYAKVVGEQLSVNGIRVEIDERNETLNAKIRDAQSEKVPYMIILGDKEKESSSLSLRLRNGENKNGIQTDEFIDSIKKNIAERSLGL